MKPVVELNDSDLDEIAERIDRKPRSLTAQEIRCVVYTARQLALQRRVLAKLAADTPQFSNPLDVFAAQNLRDQVLRLPGRSPQEP